MMKMSIRGRVLLPLLALCILLIVTTCDAWISNPRPMTQQLKASTSTRTNPRFLDILPKQQQHQRCTTTTTTRLSHPRSSNHNKAISSHNGRWSITIRKPVRQWNLWRLAGCFAAILLATAVLSPQSAIASTSTSLAAEPVATAAVTSTAYLQSLPSPVPPIVELKLTLRLLFASLLGACVGKERSSTHKHSAGVRTMALVALGACAFTLVSSFGFFSPRCDPSRMAANVASGVGFVGAGVITTSANGSDSRKSIVHGLTTATAIWISAAVGVSCGVGLLYIASFTTISTVTILRFGRVKKKIKTKASQAQEWWGDYNNLWQSRLSSGNEHTTASLEEMNEEDDWDSHVESVELHEDEEEEEQEELLPEQQQVPTTSTIRSADLDLLAEYHEMGQVSMVEGAHAASFGNQTELTRRVNENSYKASKQQNKTSEDYVRSMEPVGRKRSYRSSGSGDKGTLGP